MTTQEQVLSVALDDAEDTGQYSLELRQRIADRLAQLNLAGPWLVDPAALAVHRYDPCTGVELARVWCGDAETWNARDELGTWVGKVGEQELPFASAKLALDACDSLLREQGRVLCPTPKSEPLPIPRCEDCGGTGVVTWAAPPDKAPTPCERCEGTGEYRPCPRCDDWGTVTWGRGDMTYEDDCPQCSGGVDPGDYDDDDDDTRWEQL